MELHNRDFILLVKRTRQKFDVSIDEAHDMIFADEAMRRLVIWRVNSDQECRKQALWTCDTTAASPVSSAMETASVSVGAMGSANVRFGWKPDIRKGPLSRTNVNDGPAATRP